MEIHGQVMNVKTSDVDARDHWRVMHRVWELIGQSKRCRKDGRQANSTQRKDHRTRHPQPEGEAKKRDREADEGFRPREKKTLEYLKRTEAEPEETGHDSSQNRKVTQRNPSTDTFDLPDGPLRAALNLSKVKVHFIGTDDKAVA